MGISWLRAALGGVDNSKPDDNKEGARVLGVEIEGVACAIDLALLEEAIPQGDAPTGTVTTTHRIFPSGTFHHPFRDEPFKFNAAFRRGIMESFKASGLDVPIDFNHASANPFDSSYEAGAAAGWLTELVDKERSGLHASITWNDRGLAAIRSGEYRYISPEFSSNTFDKATGDVINAPKLFAVALTNRPFLEKQPRVAASDTHNPEDPTMDPTNKTPEPVSSPQNAELDALKTENETLQAKSDAQAVALKAVDDARRTELMERYADRIAPTARDQIAAFGAKSTPEEFGAFLDALPTVTMSDPAGQNAEPPPPEPVVPEPEPVARSKSSDGWGLEDKWVKLAEVARGINNDGTIVMLDGRTLSQADALGEVE